MCNYDNLSLQSGLFEMNRIYRYCEIYEQMINIPKVDKLSQNFTGKIRIHLIMP